MNVFRDLMAGVHRLVSPAALIAAVLFGVASVASAQVTVKLDPATVTADVGDDNVVMAVVVEAGNQPVDGVEVHLNFDPAVLQVVSLTQGTSLPIALIAPTFDNSAGTIAYAAGTFSNFPSGTFTNLTIVFEVVGGNPSPSQITFNEVLPRKTQVTFGGSALNVTLEGAEVTVNSQNNEANFSGSLTLSGLCSNLPSTVSIYEAGTNVLVRSQNVSGTDFDVLALDAGKTYDIYVKTARYLQSKLANVQLQPAPADNLLDFGAQIPGDVNGDNQISGEDYVLLKNSYALMVGDNGYNGSADFNCDNLISGEDYVLLKVNYNKVGEAPGQ